MLSRFNLKYITFLWSDCHINYANIRKYNKVINKKFKSFQWRPFLKLKMEVTTAARSRVFISYMILTIKNYQYTKFLATIHMYNKVIEIFSFQWRPF